MASPMVPKKTTYTLGLSGAKKFKTFCGHSPCFDATYNAAFPGFSISDIVCKGCWSNKPTWILLNHKDIVTIKKVFEVKVFGCRI